MDKPAPNVRAVFDRALDIDTAADRQAYLDAACAAAPEVRQKVEALLKAYQDAGSFLEGPAPDLDAGADVRPGRPAGLDGTGPFPGPASGLRFVPEAPGRVIGPYKLLQEIGEGGMGTVYMAEQTHPVRRRIALKVIKAGMDSAQVIARFEAERQALALMDHPNIARVLDAGTTPAGRPYFAMELVHGVPITTYCDDNHLTPRERLELFIPVCQALQHAHQKGVIHRDVKPGNVLITRYDGRPVPKVIDFGVAKATEHKLTERTLFTHYGTMVGTLEYMSPEQADLSAVGADTRSDIYSLGVLLYELLTGSTPLSPRRVKEAPYAEVLRMIKEEEPPRPSTRLSDSGAALAAIAARRQTEPAQLTRLVRGELDWIVMKTLEKDRNRRYQTANGLALDVQRYLNDEPVQACPPSALYRLRKLVRRNKGPVLAASLLVLALLGGIIGTTVGMIRATGAHAEAVHEADQKEHALSTARRSERDAREQLFLALLHQARARRVSRRMGQREDALDALARAAALHPDERLRDEAIAALALADVRRGPRFPAVPAGTLATVFDAAYKSYAGIDGQGVISIRRVADNKELRSIATNNASGPSELRLSPDGQFLARLDGRQAVQIWRAADGKALLGEELRPCSAVAFSADSRRVAVGQDDWVVCIDLAGARETNRWRLPAGACALAFHPHNRRLAVGYADNKFTSIYDSTRGSLVADLPVGSITKQVVAWHPDGARLAVGGSDPRIQIWDVAAKRLVATLKGHVELVWALSFHPDGHLLASASWDGVLRLWDPGTGRQLMQLPVAAIPQFSSTGRWLGCLWRGGVPVRLLEVTPSREYRTFVSSLGAGQGGYHDGAISPDGRLLALGMGPAGDRLWDLASGRELAVLPSGSNGVLFQPDGRALLTCGATGLRHWPIQGTKDADDELRLGPPRPIALPFVPHRAARSRDGRTLALVGETAGAGLVMDLTSGSVQGRPFAHPGASFVALSPDGRWVASSGWHSHSVRLWNARTGIMLHEWVMGKMAMVSFTPDSRALVICGGDAFTFWDLATLRPIRRLDRDVPHHPGYVAFAAGGLMALEMAPGVIHLNEVATGRTVAKLEDPHGDQAWWMGFTPDGTQLVVAARYAKAIHVWDLRAIRRRLKAMGLDWDWPEFPPAAARARPAGLARVDVLPGDLGPRPVLTRAQKVRQALAQHRLALQANPDDDAACNALAWLYLAAPEVPRDVKAALPLAEKAVRLAPGNAHYANTLGVAYYRAGKYRTAVRILRTNLDRQEDRGLAYDLYVLAMSHHRLGDAARARDYYAWAVRWSSARRDLTGACREELNLFRAEAEEVLHLKNGK